MIWKGKSGGSPKQDKPSAPICNYDTPKYACSTQIPFSPLLLFTKEKHKLLID